MYDFLYRSSIQTIALCLVFEKIAFFAFWRQTDRQTNKQTDEQMDSIDALSRSHCRERWLNNPPINGQCTNFILFAASEGTTYGGIEICILL